jgi:hypothetical protein
MTKRIVFGAALVLAIVAIAAPSVSANCQVSKSVSTYDPDTGLFPYWHSSLGGPGTTLVAKAWQPGGADVSGSCNTRNSPDGNAGILYFASSDPGLGSDIGVNYDLSDACVQPAAACANGLLALMATVTQGNKTEFVVSQAVESPAGITFNFSSFGAKSMVPMGRPKVTASSRVSGNVNVTAGVDSTATAWQEGTSGQATGYNILVAAAAADPGRNAPAYGPLATIAATGGNPGSTSTTVVCSTLVDRWIVTQLVTANGPSPTVSEATRIACDPALADPKFKIVPKKGMGNRPVQN